MMARAPAMFASADMPTSRSRAPITIHPTPVGGIL